MGILQRFSDIMSANINSLLSGAEEKNAGKLLEKYLADARANLEELRNRQVRPLCRAGSPGRQ